MRYFIFITVLCSSLTLKGQSEVANTKFYYATNSYDELSSASLQCKLYNSLSRDKIQTAVITIKNSDNEVSTSAAYRDNIFRIDDVPSGKYKLTCLVAGFEPYTLYDYFIPNEQPSLYIRMTPLTE